MRKILLAFAVVAGFPAAASAQAQSAPAAAPAAPAHYSTANTDIGILLDDPAAKAILEAAVPGMTTHPQVDMMRGMTLAAIQQYVPDQLTPSKIAEIDKAFQALPAKK